MILEPMATTAAEVVWSMGDDTRLALLSHKMPPLYDFLRQRFAQVTNPPIDSLRESMVMSLRMPRVIMDSPDRAFGEWRKVKPRGAVEPVALIRQVWIQRLQALIDADTERQPKVMQRS